jgi:hypothetical protein
VRAPAEDRVGDPQHRVLVRGADPAAAEGRVGCRSRPRGPRAPYPWTPRPCPPSSCSSPATSSSTTPRACWPGGFCTRRRAASRPRWRRSFPGCLPPGTSTPSRCSWVRWPPASPSPTRPPPSREPAPPCARRFWAWPRAPWSCCRRWPSPRSGSPRDGPTVRTAASSSCRSPSTRSWPATAPTGPTTRTASSAKRRGSPTSGPPTAATRSCTTTRISPARTS